MAAAVGVAVDWAIDHCTRWMHATLRGIYHTCDSPYSLIVYVSVDFCVLAMLSQIVLRLLAGVVFEEVRGGFDRLKKAVRGAGKAGHSTDVSSSSTNSTSRLHLDQASLGDDSASLSSLTQPGLLSVDASHSSDSLPASEDIDSSVSNPLSQFMVSHAHNGNCTNLNPPD